MTLSIVKFPEKTKIDLIILFGFHALLVTFSCFDGFEKKFAIEYSHKVLPLISRRVVFQSNDTNI